MATTVLVDVSITETLAEPLFATYARFPSGATVTPRGKFPTEIVVATMLVAVSITETLFEFWFVT